MEKDIRKASWQTFFRKLQHLKSLKDTMKIIHLQVYAKNSSVRRENVVQTFQMLSSFVV